MQTEGIIIASQTMVPQQFMADIVVTNDEEECVLTAESGWYTTAAKVKTAMEAVFNHGEDEIDWSNCLFNSRREVVANVKWSE